MEDAYKDLATLPDDLRRQLISFRRGREIGLRELVETQNRRFLDEVEAEMWGMLTLPGQVQPGLIMQIVGALLAADLRKQARIHVLEANALRVADYKRTTLGQEADICHVYAMSLQASKRGA